MAKVNGAQSVEKIAGRNIVLSAGVGKTNVDELKWLTETVLAEAKCGSRQVGHILLTVHR